MIINTSVITNPIQPGYFKQINVLSEGRYPFSASLIQSAFNPDVILCLISDWVLGHIWREQNQISMLKSTDRGRTWGSKQIIYNPGAGFGVMDSRVGIDPDTGRIYFHCNMYQGTGSTASGDKFLMQGYTDNDGDTWTMVDLSSLLPDTMGFASMGKLIKNNGVLMFPFYNADLIDFNPSNRFLARNDGSGWQRILVEGPTATYINESDIMAKGDNVVMVSRNEATFEFTQYKSIDNGLTWANQGALTFGESWSSASPPYLTSFYLDGVEVWAAYITNRPGTQLIVVYGLPDDVIAGPNGWNTATKLTLYDPGGTTAVYHYGSVLHPYNDIRAIGAYAFDNLGWTSTSTTKSHIFDLPSTHKTALKAQLGI